MLYLIFFILGVLIGQFALLAYVRMKLGHAAWMVFQEFYDALLDGDVEYTEDEKEEEDAENEDEGDA